MALPVSNTGRCCPVFARGKNIEGVCRRGDERETMRAVRYSGLGLQRRTEPEEKGEASGVGSQWGCAKLARVWAPSHFVEGSLMVGSLGISRRSELKLRWVGRAVRRQIRQTNRAQVLQDSVRVPVCAGKKRGRRPRNFPVQRIQCR